MRFAAFALLLSWIAGCSDPMNYFFAKLAVDPGQHLVSMGSHSLVEPEQGSYYWIFHAARLTSVDHFVRKTPTAKRERSLHLETNENERLDRTVNDDEILRGDFGLYTRRKLF